MTIRATIWDLGGVLLRRKGFARREQLAARLGYTRVELEELVAVHRWANVHTALNLSLDEMPAFKAAYWGDTRLDRALVDYIRALRPRYRTALLSNAWPGARTLLTERWQIADAFDHIIISAEIELRKPDPLIYHLALARLDVAPNEAVFLDDDEKNVQGARDIGLCVIHFQNPEQALVELQQLVA